ncbi:MAG: protein adenylyltransferase SelO [Gillisia sp.]
MRLSNKKFSNTFTSIFPGDNSGDLSPRQTPGVLYSKALPSPVSDPKLLAWTEELAEEMGIEFPNDEDIKILAGNLTTPSMFPYAACYAGHQFGNWAGQLGDGRAITLGEWESNGKSWEMQLKGAGPTAYSRMADGRAVLRSSVREYLMSEAMFHLGVPTTRALSLVTTGDKILRDMFYNGHAAYEPGAIVMRISESFLRFGNFEILAARKEKDNLQQLVDWTIKKHYPHHTGDNRIINWFQEVIEKTAVLMVEWHRVGFVHGVMNTDNMSILGQTIDYGPFSFLDDYDPTFTPNTTDLPGRRYAFGNQPSIALWNLSRLATALSPLFDDTQPLEEALNTYEAFFWKRYYEMMGNKLGLDKISAGDEEMITKLEELLALVKPDMCIFYQLLIDLPSVSSESMWNHFTPALYNEPSEKLKSDLLELLSTYAERRKINSISAEASAELMKKTNPRFILRNYLLHQAIEELEKGENTLFEKLRNALQNPYTETNKELLQKRPDWATKKAGCSMLSCSS